VFKSTRPVSEQLSTGAISLIFGGPVW